MPTLIVYLILAAKICEYRTYFINKLKINVLPVHNFIVYQLLVRLHERARFVMLFCVLNLMGLYLKGLKKGGAFFP